jgi:hypothetical protein
MSLFISFGPTSTTNQSDANAGNKRKTIPLKMVKRRKTVPQVRRTKTLQIGDLQMIRRLKIDQTALDYLANGVQNEIKDFSDAYPKITFFHRRGKAVSRRGTYQ